MLLRRDINSRSGVKGDADALPGVQSATLTPTIRGVLYNEMTFNSWRCIFSFDALCIKMKKKEGKKSELVLYILPLKKYICVFFFAIFTFVFHSRNR